MNSSFMQRIAPPDLLLPHRRSLGAGAEAADPGAGAASGGRRWARGITEAIVSRRLSGATMKAAIWHRPLAATQEAIGVLTIGAVQ